MEPVISARALTSSVTAMRPEWSAVLVGHGVLMTLLSSAAPSVSISALPIAWPKKTRISMARAQTITSATHSKWNGLSRLSTPQFASFAPIDHHWSLPSGRSATIINQKIVASFYIGSMNFIPHTDPRHPPLSRGKERVPPSLTARSRGRRSDAPHDTDFIPVLYRLLIITNDLHFYRPSCRAEVRRRRLAILIREFVVCPPTASCHVKFPVSFPSPATEY
jgi:hypothetical protein